MIRNFNYTQRKKIGRDRVRIQIVRNSGRIPSFDAELQLGDLELPLDARVFIEAQNKTQYMRFDFGTVAALTAPPDCALTEFDGSDDMGFRVKVVQPDGSKGKLLAEEDSIFPLTTEEAAGGREPLLYIRSAELGQQVWELRIEQDRTVLLLNTKVADRTAMARSKEFIALVYPAILRQIFVTIFTAERESISEDASEWRGQWLKFGALSSGNEQTRIEGAA